MRLVCPNCDAEYEIDPSVIPEAGRDVQCSNCGHAWFQTSPSVEAAEADEAALFDSPVPVDVPVTPRGPAPALPPQTQPAPRGLDETVLAVLREEAEREAAARRNEAVPLETQTEMGLAPPAPSRTPAPEPQSADPLSADPLPAPRPADLPPMAEPNAPLSPAARRVARMKGVDPDPRPAPRPQTRREMLPAIEEINSTLRATSEKRSGDPALVADTMDEARGDASASGFRNGFLLMLVIAVVGLVTYVMAPRIGQQIPGAAPAMTAYVESVDLARQWIDALMQKAITALRGLSDEGQA